MQIAVNARFFSRPYTGIGQYTKNLFSAMAELETSDYFLMITNKRMDFSGNVNDVYIRELMAGTAGMKKTYWEQVQIPRFLNRVKPDIIHYPYPSNPWHRVKTPVAVTVHDAIPWLLPSYGRSTLRRMYQKKVKSALKKADLILTVSKCSKSDLVNATGLPEEKITVVYNAADPIFSRKLQKQELAATRDKYAMGNRPFFLYAGGFDERKNVDFLVSCFTELVAPHVDADLVLVGGKYHESSLYSNLDNLTKAKTGHRFSSKKGKIVVTGFISENELAALYQSARAFINLSMMEGFNLPLIEAAVSKTPIIISDIPVHREIAGDLPIYVDTRDPKKIAETMIKMISDNEFHSILKQKSDAYICPYSWERAAKVTYKLYKSILCRRG